MLASRSIRHQAVPLVLTAFGLLGSPAAMAQRTGQGPIPVDTVVRLKMDSTLSSRDARVGDRFAVVLSENDRSGFPEGTRFQGVVREVQRHTEGKPGLLDVEIRRAFLPDGRKVVLSGRLASLAGDDVRRMENGRLESRKRDGGKVDWKWAGYGAAGGAVLSTIFGGGILNGVLLGGLGGAVYGYLNRDKGSKDQFRDVDLPIGTEFGMRLEQQAAFDDRPSYRYTGSAARQEGSREEERVLGARQERRYREATVRLNGRDVELDARPMNLNGILYVPLEPIARAANLRFMHRADQDGFTLETSAGRAQADAGEARVTLAGGQVVTLAEEPMSIDGTIFVSADYLSRVANLRADWNPAQMRLDLEAQK